MEAMASGLPVVATRWSAHLEFMNDRNSFLVDVDRMVALDKATEQNYFSGQLLADPSTEHLTTLLRTVPVERWLRGATEATVTVPAGSPVVRVEIDPDHGYPDVDRANNVSAVTFSTFTFGSL